MKIDLMYKLAINRVVILALFGLCGYSTSYAETVNDYLQRIKSEGYSVVGVTNDPKRDITTIHLEKSGETEDTHGLLKKQWQIKDTWKLQYIDQGSILVFRYIEAYREERAPVLGQWRRQSMTPPFPDNLIRDSLSIQ